MHSTYFQNCITVRSNPYSTLYSTQLSGTQSCVNVLYMTVIYPVPLAVRTLYRWRCRSGASGSAGTELEQQLETSYRTMQVRFVLCTNIVDSTIAELTSYDFESPHACTAGA